MATRAEARYTLTAKDKSGPAFKSFKTSLRTTATAAGKMAKIGFVAAIAGFSIMAKKALDSADKVQKLSQQLGASTELLSELRGISQLSGVSFDKVSASIGKMSKNIGQALLPGAPKELTRAFDVLKISALDLQQMNVDQQFLKLGAGINNIKDTSIRAAVGTAIFGKSYKDLLNIFSGGIEGVRAMRKEQQALGNSLSKDQVDAAAEANDAMARLQQTIEGLVGQLAIEFAPGLAEFATKLTKVVIPAANWAADVFTTLTDNIGRAMAFGAQFLQGNFMEAANVAQGAAADYDRVFGGVFSKGLREAQDGANKALGRDTESVEAAILEELRAMRLSQERVAAALAG